MVAPTPSSPPEQQSGHRSQTPEDHQRPGRAGSLAGAALSLNLTQSALSHQLKELETRLNLELFLPEKAALWC